MVKIDDYKRAERELALREARRGWRIHAAIFALVNTGLVTLNVVLIAFTDANVVWFPFPLVGWGIGLTFHYLHGVRWAARDVRAHQDAIERYAETTRRAA